MHDQFHSELLCFDCGQWRRFVAQNEAIASVKEVYPTQGIFIKLNNSEAGINYLTSRNKGRSDLPSIINAALSEMQPSGGGSRLSVATPMPNRTTGTSGSAVNAPNAPGLVSSASRSNPAAVNKVGLSTAANLLEGAIGSDRLKVAAGNNESGMFGALLSTSQGAVKRSTSPQARHVQPTNEFVSAKAHHPSDPIASASTRTESRFHVHHDSPIPPFVNLTQSSLVKGGK
jgi:hypothetical protein